MITSEIFCEFQKYMYLIADSLTRSVERRNCNKMFTLPAVTSLSHYAALPSPDLLLYWLWQRFEIM